MIEILGVSLDDFISFLRRALPEANVALFIVGGLVAIALVFRARGKAGAWLWFAGIVGGIAWAAHRYFPHYF